MQNMDFNKIVSSHTDFNRFVQQKGYVKKENKGVSFYIAQSQAKKECTAKFRIILKELTGNVSITEEIQMVVEEIESHIEGKCLKVKSQKTLSKWLENDWNGLAKALGLINMLKRLSKKITEQQKDKHYVR